MTWLEWLEFLKKQMISHQMQIFFWTLRIYQSCDIYFFPYWVKCKILKNTTPHNSDVTTITPHLMQNFLGIKHILVMWSDQIIVTWSILLSLLSKMQNIENNATPHSFDITTIIPHMMKIFLASRITSSYVYIRLVLRTQVAAINSALQLWSL